MLLKLQHRLLLQLPTAAVITAITITAEAVKPHPKAKVAMLRLLPKATVVKLLLQLPKATAVKLLLQPPKATAVKLQLQPKLQLLLRPQLKAATNLA